MNVDHRERKRLFVVLAMAACIVLSFSGLSMLLNRDTEPLPTQINPQIHEGNGEGARSTVAREANTLDSPRSDFMRSELGDLLEGAVVLKQRHDDTATDSEKARTSVRLVHKEGLKYPLLRIEESTVRTRTGGQQVVMHSSMAADHVVVKLKPGKTQRDLDELNRKFGAKVLRKLRIPGWYLVGLERKDIDAVRHAIAAYTSASAVSKAEPDYFVRIVDSFPSDPEFSQLWGLHNTGQTGGTVDADIDAPAAWERSTGSRNVVVGIIDTGIDYTHPDLAANIWTNSAEIPGNGIDDDGNGYIDDVRGWDFYNNDNDPLDDHFHGSHCAGTVGAVGSNGVGVAGVCWRVSLVPLKFLGAGGSGYTSDAADAIQYATSMGVHLTSNSWGGGGYAQVVKDAIDSANSAGILFVAAAGNSNSDNDISPHYPSSYASPNIIAVAASDHNDQLATFSSYGGNSVHLAAPGVSIYSTFPTSMTGAMSSGGFNTDYDSISGTSMATPHVSGACALLKAFAPSLPHWRIKEQILNGVDPVPSLSGSLQSGGRLNLLQAMNFGDEPFIFVSAVVNDDGNSGNSFGNGDGILNPGERIEVGITAINAGQLAASGVTMTAVMSSDPYISLLQDSSSFGDLAGGASALGAPDLVVDVAAGTPTPYAFSLELAFQDASSNSWTYIQTFTVDQSHTISGAVTLDGVPLQSANVSLSGALAANALSGADGAYAFSTTAGAYTVAAQFPGYLAPEEQAVVLPPNASDVDFAFATVNVSGTVKDEITGLGIADAEISFRGAFSGSTSTQSDGTFNLQAVVGRSTELSVTARKPSLYFDSLPTVVRVPPSHLNVDFLLKPAPDIHVTPSSFTVNCLLGDAPQRTLTIENLRNSKLSFQIEKHSGRYISAQEGDILDVILGAPLLGAFRGVAYDGNHLWFSQHSDLLLKKDRSAFLLDRWRLEGMADSVWPLAWDAGKLWIGDWDTKKILLLDMQTRQVVRSFDSPDSLVPAGLDVGAGALWVYVFGAIHKLDPVTGTTQARFRIPEEFSLSDLAWYDGVLYCGSNKCEIYKISPVDGSVLGSFRVGGQSEEIQIGEAIRGITPDREGGLWVATDYATYRIATGRLHWLSVDPEWGEVLGADSIGATVHFNSLKSGPGTFHAALHVKSNDPDEPDVKIPVTFQVTDPANTPPVAQDQNLTVEGALTDVVLAAADANGDTLTFTVLDQPQHGFLEGTAPNLQYAPLPGFQGTDSFTFQAHDGLAESNVATVTLHVGAAPDIALAPDGFSEALSLGEVTTRTLTVQNTGSRVLDATIWSQTDRGGPGGTPNGNLIRVLDIAHHFPPYSSVHPEIGPGGLAFDGAHLWITSISNWQNPNSELWKLDPLDGRILEVVDVEGITDPEMLSWDGQHMWMTSINDRRIYVVDLRNRTLVRTIDYFTTSEIRPHGIRVVGNVLYTIGFLSTSYGFYAYIYEFDAVTGQFFDRTLIPNFFADGVEHHPFGLTYLNGALWFSEFPHNRLGRVFQYDLHTKLVTKSFQAPDLLFMGLASDCEGGLWNASRTSRKLYYIGTGEQSWLRISPRKLAVAPGGSVAVTLTLDANAGGPGEYAADLHIECNDPDERHLIVPVHITQPNQAPVADAGQDRTVPKDSAGTDGTFFLNGYGSKDVDGTITSYEWKKGGATIATGVYPQVSLSAGQHTIALHVTDNDGATGTDTVTINIGPLPTAKVWAWGVNGSGGALGNNSNQEARRPVAVSGNPTFTQVSGGSGFSLGLKPDGTLMGWGSNAFGQLGDPSIVGVSQVPVPITTIDSLIAISAGRYYSLGLKRDGTVWAWGDNIFGQLGDGTNVDRDTPVQVQNLDQVVAIAASGSHSLALRADGTVWAWGDGSTGKLGDGTLVSRWTPVKARGLKDIIAIATGGDTYQERSNRNFAKASGGFSLALDRAGTIWGFGNAPNIGIKIVPRPDPVLSNVVGMDGGVDHALFLRSDGTVWSCGEAELGQLGHGDREDLSTPKQIAGLNNVAAVQAGSSLSFAILQDGTVQSWGYRLVGDGSTATRYAPVDAGGLTNVIQFHASVGSHQLVLGNYATPPNVPPNALAGADQTISLPLNRVDLDGSSSHDTDGDLVAWQWSKVSGGTAVINSPDQPQTQINGLIEGAYTFRLTVTDNDGAQSSAEVRVYVGAATITPGVWSWGKNTYGEMGNGTSSNFAQYTPVRALEPSNFTAIEAGIAHVIALREDGSVWGWGSSQFGALGQAVGDKTRPQQIPGLIGITAIAAADRHNLALRSDGTVWGWGQNENGELGNGNNSQQSNPVQAVGVTGAIAVAMGRDHSLALLSNGTVMAWGDNNSGQLGDGSFTDRSIPVTVPGLSDVQAIACGGYHSLALKSDGSVWAWGLNSSGQLGDGTTTNQNQPRMVPGISNIQQICGGNGFTLAFDANRTIWSWGWNLYGQLGDGTTTNRHSAVKVLNLPGVTKIEAGANSALSLALRADGTVWAWGSNGGGRLGDGLTFSSSLPFQVPNLVGMTHLAVGSESAHTMKQPTASPQAPIIFSALGVRGIKDQAFGYRIEAAGDPVISFSTGTLPPGLVHHGDLIEGIPTSTGTWHMPLQASNAVGADNRTLTITIGDNLGNAFAWGLNQFGRLGDGTTVNRHTPVKVVNLDSLKNIDGGAFHSLGLKTDGTVWSWGRNTAGELGDGTTTDRHTPGQVSVLSNIAAISAGNSFNLAVDSNGKLWSWGYNHYGQLGINSTTQKNTPLGVNILTSGVQSISAGVTHALACKTDGTVWGWGRNDFGQVGDGSTTSPRKTPRLVSGLANGILVASGNEHSLALTADGKVWAWGRNFYGQIGDGTNTGTHHVPKHVAGLMNAVAIAAGSNHSVALLSDGTVWAWGNNAMGQLGDGTITNRHVPTMVPGLSEIVQIDAHLQHTIARAADGSVWTWGQNSSGEVGDGSTGIRRELPVRVGTGEGLVRADCVAAGDSHNLALLTENAVFTYTLHGKVAWHGVGLEGVLVSDGTRSTHTDAAGWFKLSGVPVGSYTVTATKANYDILPKGWSNPVRVASMHVGGLEFEATFGQIVSGRVTQGGAGLANVNVTLDSRGTTTDTNGEFVFDDVADGTYTLAAERSGYSIAPNGWNNPVAVAGAHVLNRDFNAIVAPTPPSITSGLNVTTEVGQPFGYTVTADGSQPVSYQVTGVPQGLTVSGPTISGTPTLVGQFSVTLRADNSFGSDVETLNLIVYDPFGLPNISPEIASEPWADPNPIILPETTTLHVVASDGDGPQVLTYTWSKMSGPGDVMCSPNGTTASNHCVASFNRSGTYVMRVTVSDGQAAVTGDCVIYVLPAVRPSGTLRAWGRNDFKQLGDETNVNKWSPITVLGLSDVTDLTAGRVHSLALKRDGTVWAWGQNQNYGSVGNGSAFDQGHPMQLALPPIRQIAAGGDHSLVVSTNGQVYTWGKNVHGQLGQANTVDQATPVPIPALTNAAAVACGGEHSLCLRADGTVWAWGYNFRGRLGDGTSSTRLAPVQVTNLANVVALAAGADHSLALRSDGTVWAWGGNVYGQLGDNTQVDKYEPEQVQELTGIVQIAAGGYHSLARSFDGRIYAWGANEAGQLGLGHNQMQPAPIEIPGLAGVIDLACGNSHSLAVHEDGSVRTWGPYVGDGSPDPQNVPVVVSGIVDALRVSAGNDHSLVIAGDGVGYTISGTVRHNGSTISGVSVTNGIQTVYTNASGLYEFNDLFPGQYSISASHSSFVFTQAGWSNPVMIVSADVTGRDFEANYPPTANAGTDQTYSQPAPPVTLNGSGSDLDGTIVSYQWVQIKGSAAILASSDAAAAQITGLSSGTSTFRLTVTDDDGASATDEVSITIQGSEAWGWGSNYYGQVGDGASGYASNGAPVDRATPVEIAGIGLDNLLKRVSAGTYHSMGIKEDGSVWTWGLNDFGQLGDGTTEQRPVMVQVSELSNIFAVACSSRHSLAFRFGGHVWAWGDNFLGQLGNGSTMASLTPVQVPGLSGVTAVASGEFHNLALKADGTVWSWGHNGSGRLGDGTTIDRFTPVQVFGLNNMVSVAAGQSHSLALRSDGRLFAWGGNGSGQLGLGHRLPVVTPAEITSLDGIQRISARAHTSLALKADGTVWQWGMNRAPWGLPGSPVLGLPATIGEWETSVAYNVDFILPAPASEDLEVTLENSDSTEISIPASFMVPAGVHGVSFPLSGVNDSDKDGIQKVTITARCSMGTVSASVYVLDDEDWVSSEFSGRPIFGDNSQPRMIENFGDVIAISAGSAHCLALKSDRTLWTWGYHTSYPYQKMEPQQVPSLSNITSFSAGGYHNLATSVNLAPTILIAPTANPNPVRLE